MSSDVHTTIWFFFFFQAEDGIRDKLVTGFRRVLFRSLEAERRRASGPVYLRADAMMDRPNPNPPADLEWLQDPFCRTRSEEHTSELQSLAYLVCRLLLEKKKIRKLIRHTPCPIHDCSQ